MSRWQDSEWTDAGAGDDPSWAPLFWLLLGGYWNDAAYWVDGEDWL